MITRDAVKHVAELASLSASDAEMNELARELEQIVAYVDELQTIDTTNIAPMTRVSHGTTTLRQDVTEPCLSRDEALAQAPRANESGFLVPKFVEST